MLNELSYCITEFPPDFLHDLHYSCLSFFVFEKFYYKEVHQLRSFEHYISNFPFKYFNRTNRPQKIPKKILVSKTIGPTVQTKKHFLEHYLHLICCIGPAMDFWTFHFEAKHSFFKKVIHVVNNFKNILMTVPQT